MNNEFVMVPRDWAESMIAAGAGEPASKSDLEILKAALAQPAAQHQGEPVALPERKQYTSHADTSSFKDGWNACLDEIAKLGPLYTQPVQGEPVAWAVFTDSGNIRIWSTDCEAVGIKVMQEEGKQAVPLYTRADTGEVELLRESLRIEKARGALLNDARIKAEESQWVAERKLAERDALLREWYAASRQTYRKDAPLLARTESALSASAEPMAQGQCEIHSNTVPLGPYGVFTFASAEPSAPKCPPGEDCCIDGNSTWCPSHPRSAPVERDGWIPTAERKPEYDKVVLVAFDTHQGKNFTTAHLTNQKRCADPRSTEHDEVWYVHVSGGHRLKTVTHWREIDRAALERKP